MTGCVPSTDRRAGAEAHRGQGRALERGHGRVGQPPRVAEGHAQDKQENAVCTSAKFRSLRRRFRGGSVSSELIA